MTHPLKPVEAALEKIIEDDTCPTSKRIGFAAQDATAALVNLRSVMRGEMRSVEELALYLSGIITPDKEINSRMTVFRAAVEIVRNEAFSAGMSAARGWCDDMSKTPRDGTLVVFYNKRLHLSRADDYWNKAPYLDGTTHWMPLPSPPAPTKEG
jgi:hypothetical protein